MQQQPGPSPAVHDLLLSVCSFLVNRIDPADFAILVSVLYEGLPQQIEPAISHVLTSLVGKIPHDMYADLFRQITVCLNNNKYINNSIYNQISYFLIYFFSG